MDLLTKQMAIKDNRDPRGVKWGIGKIKGTSLYHIDVVEGNKLTGKPKEFDSKFTNPTLAQKTVEAFLETIWDESDRKAAKLDRKAGRDEVIQE
jgi:hypothetical protein